MWRALSEGIVNGNTRPNVAIIVADGTTKDPILCVTVAVAIQKAVDNGHTAVGDNSIASYTRGTVIHRDGPTEVQPSLLDIDVTVDVLQ